MVPLLNIVYFGSNLFYQCIAPTGQKFIIRNFPTNVLPLRGKNSLFVIFLPVCCPYGANFIIRHSVFLVRNFFHRYIASTNVLPLRGKNSLFVIFLPVCCPYGANFIIRHSVFLVRNFFHRYIASTDILPLRGKNSLFVIFLPVCCPYGAKIHYS